MTTQPITDAEPRASRREWIALAVLILPLLLVSMDVSVLYFAVPYISADLDPSATQQLWIFDIYGFVLAGFLLTMGSLGDRIGRRRLLLIGAACFSAASLAAAYAHTPEMLIAARAVLGVAGATLMPSTLALIRNLFRDAKQRATAIAVWSGVLTAGVAVGPILSGVLLEHFWWGSVFLINIPAMALLLGCGPLLLPEFRSPAPGRFDVISSVLSLAAILPIVYGIKQWAAEGYSIAYAASIAAGVGVGIAFISRQRRVEDSLLDLTLFSDRGFRGSIVVNGIAMFAMIGNAVFLTQYIQSVLGLSPFVAALWSLVPSLAVGAAAPLSAVLAKCIDRAYVMTGGFLIAAGGFIIITRVEHTNSLAMLLIGAGVLSSGLVAVISHATDEALGAVHPERAGSASAVLETSSELGGALGIALLGSTGAVFYHSHMNAAADVPDAARDSLGGALASSIGLPDGARVVQLARDAFTVAMHGEATVGAVIMIAGALTALLLLRTRTRTRAADV